MKLYKTIPDRILNATNSTPEQLLAWFREIYAKNKNHELGIGLFPCNSHPYLNRYSFSHRPNKKMFNCGHDKNKKDVFDIWWYARESDKHFNDIVNQFKKLYKISEAEQ